MRFTTRAVRPLAADDVVRWRARPWSYDDPGVTRGGAAGGPLGLDRAIVLGRGDRVWDRAVDALLTWQVQLGAGLRVAVSSPRVVEGAVVLLGFGPARLHLSAPCRVVWVSAGPARQAFAYGTLPGHPESGEEAFTLTRAADDAVSFRVTASSRGGWAVARWGGPVTRTVQHRIVARYLAAMAGLAGA